MASGGAGVPPRRICFFGTFDRRYTVARALMQACSAAGFAIVECHEPLWERARIKGRKYFSPANLVWLLAAYALCSVRLARRLRRLPKVDAFVVGFQGQLDMILLRRVLRQPGYVAFAPLVTLSETLIDDRQIYPKTSLPARLMRWIDGASLHAASRAIFDTAVHRDFVAQAFALPTAKASVWHLGCDNQAFHQRPQRRVDGTTRVLFYGSFLPLHGIEIILEAASLLADDGHIQIDVSGDGPDAPAAAELVRSRRLKNVRLAPWQSYESLENSIANADVCLGIFGGSRKAQMVIPNKVYQCATVGRAIITADSPAVREVFTHDENIWLCAPSDPQALAKAIRDLSHDPVRCLRLGHNAGRLMADRFSTAQQAQRIATLLDGTLQA